VRPRARHLLPALLLLTSSTAALSQIIPPSEQPGRERERFIERRLPAVQPGGPTVALPSTEAPPGAAETRIFVRRIVIVGSTIYTTEQLAPLYQDIVRRRVSVQEIYELARRITAKYGADGYVLTRAIVPEQELEPSGATVRIEVIEGFINRVEWPREKLARYRDFFTEYAAKIMAERPLNIRTLERYLLLATDLPGLKFTTTLKASEKEKGASTLVVNVEEKPLDVYARVDNRGTAARGPWQFLVQPTINNVLGAHEALTIAYAGVMKLRELQFVAPSYRQVLNSEGLTAFANASYSWGRPGTVILEEIEFKTRSLYVEGGVSYPFIRSRERNFIGSIFAFASESYSYALQDTLNVDRLRGLRARADVDFADSWNGINQFSGTFSQGIEGLGSTQNGSELHSRLAGRVDFTKVEAYVSRLQPLIGPFSALIAAYAQYAFDALLSPEQCGYGGRVFGRAFDPSELLGDRCWELSAELRADVPPPVSMLPRLQFYGFTDRGKVDTISPAVGTAGNAVGASAGGGVRLGWQQYVNVDLSAVKAVEGPRNDWRYFLIATARY
jgi:hemolysin activation/secretion protein